MGLLTTLLTLPVSGPMKAALWVSDEVRKMAEAEYSDPKFIRKQLELLEQQLLEGQLSEDEFETAEMELLLRLKDAEAAQKANRAANGGAP